MQYDMNAMNFRDEGYGPTVLTTERHRSFAGWGVVIARADRGLSDRLKCFLPVARYEEVMSKLGLILDAWDVEWQERLDQKQRKLDAEREKEMQERELERQRREEYVMLTFSLWGTC